MSDLQKDAIRGLMSEMLKGAKGDFSKYTLPDCTFVVPGGPPLPLPVLAGMCEDMLGAFPWTNSVQFPADPCFEFDEITQTTIVKAMTKQNLGVMKGDIPAMGPFPFVKMADVPPETAKQAIILPWETGTYVFEGDKIKSVVYKAEDEPQDLDKDATTMHLPIPVGFPAIYNFLGVEIPPAPQTLPTILMQCEVAEYEAWLSCFQEHADSTSFTYKDQKHTVGMTRGECLDVKNEEVFYDIKDKNKIIAVFPAVDMAKLGQCMTDPAFVEGIKDSVVSQEAPTELKDLPPPPKDGEAPPAGRPATAPPAVVPRLLFSYEVESPETWIEGFLAHGSSKTGTWGVEAKYTRAEFCDEAKTRVFRSAKNPKRVAGMLFDVDVAKMGEFMAHESFKTIGEVLKFKEETMQIKQVFAMPPPPAAHSEPESELPTLLIQADVVDFPEWEVSFKEHATSKSFHYKGKETTVSLSRGDCLDVAKEELFCDIKDQNKILAVFPSVNMEKLGKVMSEEAFVEGTKDSVVKHYPPTQLKDLPEPPEKPKSGSPDAAAAPAEDGMVSDTTSAEETVEKPKAASVVPAVFFSYEVEDVDRWIAGFLAHGESKTGTWGVEAKYARKEFCDEAKTRVFRSTSNPKKVAGLCYDMDVAKMGEFMAHESFKVIGEVLKFKQETMTIKQVV